jgi:hypothetical protein
MVESAAEVLVKEERQPEVIPIVVPPSNLPLAAVCILYVSLFLISTSIHREIKSQGYI